MPRSLLGSDQAEGNFIVEDEPLNNPVQTWTYTDQAARLAATGFGSEDKGKLALQESDNTYWVLTNHSPIAWVDFSHRRSHSLFSGDHPDAPLTSPTDGRIFKWNSGLGRFEFVADEAGGAAQTRPGAASLGSILSYPNQGSFTAANDVEYTRIFLFQGEVITDLETFLEDTVGNNSIRLGLYDQTDPEDDLLGPNNKVAEIALRALVTGDEGNFIREPLAGGDYTVPASGFYWVAFTCTSSAVKFVATATYRADFAPRRVQSGTGTLPATASGLTNPQGAILYAAAIKE